MSHSKICIACVLLLVVIALSGALSSQKSAKLNEELPPGPMQQKATTACLECHEARIIVQQRLSKAVWTKEVDKMIRWGAVVEANDHDSLVDYLSANFSPEKPAYVPPRSAADKTAGNSKAGSR